jgi:phosphatidylglycerol:prolipoprotein diacylglycerol transferase
MNVDPYAPVHPTFLYESLWCLGSFLILLFIYKKCRKFSGQLFLTYGVLYGTGRAIIEGFRTDSLYIGDTTLRVSQVLSGVVALLFLAALIYMLIKTKKNPKPIEGIDFFPEPTPKKDKKKKADIKAAEKAEPDTDSTEENKTTAD